jgi:hypothetical protein
VKHTDNTAIFYSFDDNILTQPNDPLTSLSTLPNWYREAKRYLDDDTSKSTFKACMSFFDAMSVGYVLTTPADIVVEINGNDLSITIDDKYKNFLQMRPPMQDFAVPDGCYAHHLALLPQWGLRLPEGYSALYMAPLNRFDLPFITTNGVVENDKMDTPGMIPVFLKQNFKGVIPKGTPFVQILPFKRESWSKKVITLTQKEADEKRNVANIFRSEPTGVYKKIYWERKVYE